jgi:hypothetical protein
MRRLLGIILALHFSTAGAAVIDIKLYDAFGASYESTRIGERLAAIYNIQFDPTMVLILGPSLQDERVREQERIVADIDPDEYGILFAIGTPRQQTYGKGFSLAPNTAAELLPAPDGFRVLVLGPDGTVLRDARDILSREQLIEIAPGGG